MDLGPLRTLTTELNFSAHGVDAIVTRPSPDDTPITTRGIWVLPTTEGFPTSSEFPRQEPVRRLAIPRVDVPTVPRGTLVSAPELSGGTPLTWQVDGLDHVDVHQTRVFVVPGVEPT